MTGKTLNNLPHSDEIWRGIGGHFDSLGQIVSEFVDNSIANIMATEPMNRSIALSFEDHGDSVSISIEDSGSGIKNLDNAFRLGGMEDKQGPLNEHGFGMKHALASANPQNDAWVVCTRTHEDLNRGVYEKIKAPFQIQDLPVSIQTTEAVPWPGQFNGSGTFVQFSCSREMFYTLRTGMPGQAGFATCIGYLIEDLGFIYAGLIQRNVASFTVRWSTNGQSKSDRVEAVVPSWEQFYRPPGEGAEDYDLGNGKVSLKYSFGAMKEAGYKKYYKRNMSSSGLEVRLNGRVLAHNLFKEVWSIERHNMYNHLLVTVDIISDKAGRLPATRTSKNGLRQGDPLLESLYEWVRRKLPTPSRRIEDASGEADLLDELYKRKNDHVPDPKSVKREQRVFSAIGESIQADLYLSYGDKVWIYEGKKDTTTVKDVYQLKMYWDGAALDNLGPTNGVLIASHHPDSVRNVVEHLNQMKDIHGNAYNFEIKTWKDEGIEYPDPF